MGRWLGGWLDQLGIMQTMLSFAEVRAALWTKKLFPSQNNNFENGVIVKIVIGPEEMPILVWVRRKGPPTKMGST